MQGFPCPGGAIDLELRRGQAVCLRGPSGSGKTSLLRALAGLEAPLRPRRVVVDGSDPGTWEARRLPAMLGWAPQVAADALVGLTVAGEFRFRSRQVPPGLRPDQDVATLSSGEARRVVLELAAGRGLLLLDEPAEGLDEAGLAHLRHALQRRGEAAVVFVDHDGRLEDLADRVVELGPAPRPPLAPLPPAGDPVVEAPAAAVQRGPRVLHLPAVQVKAGLHLLLGPNGCGKTTLLRRLAGLEPAQVHVAGRSPVPGRTTRWSSARARDHLTRLSVADELVGVDGWVADLLVPSHLRGRHPLHLSGGEAQRVALAKALGRPAAAYLLDEPEAHLDAAGRSALVAVLGHRIEQGAAAVVASHDPAWRAVAHDLTEWGR